jgi:hypothetical protein
MHDAQHAAHERVWIPNAQQKAVCRNGSAPFQQILLLKHPIAINKKPWTL